MTCFCGDEECKRSKNPGYLYLGPEACVVCGPPVKAQYSHDYCIPCLANVKASRLKLKELKAYGEIK